MKESSFIRDLFSWTIFIVAVSLVFDLLESVFSKDDGIINKNSADILSNRTDKNEILKAVSKSRANGGKAQKVILSNQQTVEISA